MEKQDWKQICGEVCRIARRAGEFIASERQTFSAEKVESKGEFNFVSYVDKGAEQIIVSALSQLLPQAGFIAEEGSGGTDDTAPLQWIVDPLDGTTNFVHGMPPYAVSIALYDTQARRIVVGVIHEVTVNETFYACEGEEGAFLNGKPIRVSDVGQVEDSLIITGMAYGLSDEMIDQFVRSFNYFNRYSHGARRLGSTATDLAYIAAGRGEAFYQVNLSPWDVAAGAFLVEKAGGKVTDFQAGDDYIFGRSVIAANSRIWQPVFDLITGKF